MKPNGNGGVSLSKEATDFIEKLTKNEIVTLEYTDIDDQHTKLSKRDTRTFTIYVLGLHAIAASARKVKGMFGGKNDSTDFKA